MLPDFLRPFFWSYNFSELETEKHKKLIIGQILNYGTKQACDWLFSQYPKKEIARVAEQIPTGQWSKRSLVLWQAVLGIKTRERSEKFLTVTEYKLLVHRRNGQTGWI